MKTNGLLALAASAIFALLGLVPALADDAPKAAEAVAAETANPPDTPAATAEEAAPETASQNKAADPEKPAEEAPKQ